MKPASSENKWDGTEAIPPINRRTSAKMSSFSAGSSEICPYRGYYAEPDGNRIELKCQQLWRQLDIDRAYPELAAVRSPTAGRLRRSWQDGGSAQGWRLPVESAQARLAGRIWASPSVQSRRRPVSKAAGSSLTYFTLGSRSCERGLFKFSFVKRGFMELSFCVLGFEFPRSSRALPDRLKRDFRGPFTPAWFFTKAGVRWVFLVLVGLLWKWSRISGWGFA